MFTTIIPVAPCSIEVPSKSHLVAIVVTKDDLDSQSTITYDQLSIPLLGMPHLNDVMAMTPILNLPILDIGFWAVAWIADGCDGFIEEESGCHGFCPCESTPDHPDIFGQKIGCAKVEVQNRDILDRKVVFANQYIYGM